MSESEHSRRQRESMRRMAASFQAAQEYEAPPMAPNLYGRRSQPAVPAQSPPASTAGGTVPLGTRNNYGGGTFERPTQQASQPSTYNREQYPIGTQGPVGSINRQLIQSGFGFLQVQARADPSNFDVNGRFIGPGPSTNFDYWPQNPGPHPNQGQQGRYVPSNNPSAPAPAQTPQGGRVPPSQRDSQQTGSRASHRGECWPGCGH